MTVLPFPCTDAVASLVDPANLDDAGLDALDAMIAAADRASGDCDAEPEPIEDCGDAEESTAGYLHRAGSWRGAAVHTMEDSHDVR